MYHFKPQPSIESINENLDDNLFESFSKKLPEPAVKLSQLREQITSKNQVHGEIMKMILFVLGACFMSTTIYTSIIALLGLFRINIGISILMGCSSIAMFYGSAFFIGRFLSNRKIFPHEKEEDISRNLFKQFNAMDSTLILNELKDTLSQSLEKTQIQKYNLAVYDFIKEGIHRLDGDFSKLKYEIDSSEKRQKFSLDPFRNFFAVVSELESAIESAKSIKVINE